ncbi:zf-RVT domain-containing protein [Cephalotus follicularis]|uniref:Zf-RVT domain-containing protein n=1 Tax=Cephalotus follicularis TaxID=3775 RepID=A0A1Q3B1L2_CEPFO|nr:zf-RVT domain-containing protein [Cephalotus follicularis]
MLPLTYLGLPLITKRLTKVDCTPLVQCITAIVNSWTSKTLSFAGRLQLVKATLINMQTYWCSTFLLPMHTVRQCERTLRKFLWGGHGRGKVQWAEVCKPLAEGGLGIKDMKTWNKSLLLKQIWAVLTEDTLWVKWCQAYLLNTSNLWAIPARGLFSWSWRQILLLRPLAREHLIYKCGNGERFSLWFDPLLQGDSIHALYGHKVMYDTCLGTETRVKEMLWEGEWCWPQVSSDLIEIQQRVGDIPVSTNPDQIFWGKKGDTFSTNRAWQAIRDRSNIVEWHGVVWHPKRIPKHAFSLWLAIRGAHRTRDKLLNWGVTQTAQYVFHCREIELTEHLFFQCPYSTNVWKEVLELCNITRPILPWATEVQWMTEHTKGNKFHHSVRKLALTATVYHVWIERNRRCFKNRFLPFQELVKKVREDMGGKLSISNHSQRSYRHHNLCINWGIPLVEGWCA